MTEHNIGGNRPLDGKEPLLESRIAQFERALGLTSRGKVLLEAKLLIDRPFFDYAVVSGNPKKPERLLGDEAWAGHLSARLFAKEYGKQPLTIDFIKGLHNRHLEWTHPDATENFSDRPNPQGGIGILSSEEAKTVYFNPLLQWQSHDRARPQPEYHDGGFNFHPDTGTFLYIPYGRDISTRESKLQILQRLCDWYNGNRDGFYSTSEGPSHALNPYARGGQVQHRFVSLHPLIIDYNGRVSRDLMNWSLENDGYPPSALNTYDDHTFNEKQWIEEVKRGSLGYASISRALIRDPSMELNRLFGLLPEIASHYKHELMRYLASHPGLQNDIQKGDISYV